VQDLREELPQKIEAAAAAEAPEGSREGWVEPLDPKVGVNPINYPDQVHGS
jgi:hypothetical protein